MGGDGGDGGGEAHLTLTEAALRLPGSEEAAHQRFRLLLHNFPPFPPLAGLVRDFNRVVLNARATFQRFSCAGGDTFCNPLKVMAAVKVPSFQTAFLKHEHFTRMTANDLSEVLSQAMASSFFSLTAEHQNLCKPLPCSTTPDPLKPNVTATDIPSSELGSAIPEGTCFTKRPRGPIFMGQVFTLYDAAGMGPVSIIPARASTFSESLRMMAPLLYKSLHWIRKVVQEELEDTSVRFFLSKDDAESVVKRLRFHCLNCKVGSYPLDAAYEGFRFLMNPRGCKFVPDCKQVKLAKQLLQRNHQGKVKQLNGVPVFSVENVTLAMVTPNGIRWVTPYFFEKENLDVLIEHSVNLYFKGKTTSRRSQRHKQFFKDELHVEMNEEHPEIPFDPVEEFLNDDDHDGVSLDSVLLKGVQVQFQDWFEELILGNKWGRRFAGIQPTFSLVVDSFEQIAAAAENGFSNGARRKRKESEAWLSGKDDAGEQEVGLQYKDGAMVEKQAAVHASGQRIADTRTQQESAKHFFGMVTSPDLVEMNDTLMKEVLASAAKDVSDHVKKGNEDFEMRDPLFLANVINKFNIHSYPLRLSPQKDESQKGM